MKTTTTYSSWQAFKCCRKKYELRYEKRLVPLAISENFNIGSNVHACLEGIAKGYDLQAVNGLLDSLYPMSGIDYAQSKEYALIKAMVTSYCEKYKEEPFEYVSVEETFEGEIINPATGAKSLTFNLSGKVDGIIRFKNTGDYYILEHKTSSSIKDDIGWSAYKDRLWCDFQIILYSHYIEQTKGIKISGILYDVLGKSGLIMKKGETEEDYLIRKAALEAKSTTGKPSTAKQQIAETFDEFYARLSADYESNKDNYFRRETIFFTPADYQILQSELWELTQSMLEAKRRGVFYKNTAFCYNFKNPCEYFKICSSHESPAIINQFYREEKPHSELKAEPF